MSDLIDRPSASPDADKVASDIESIIEMCSIQLEHALFSMHLLALTDGWRYMGDRKANA